MNTEELRFRLSAVANGPWQKGLSVARTELAPIDELNVPIGARRQIDLSDLQLTVRNKRKNRQLTQVLRAHFADETGITDRSEMETREAFDRALILPELYELAVQTGYLPQERIWRPARRLLSELLWSPAAQNYVAIYDFVGVQMLAARVGVSGLGEVQAPDPNIDASLRFAGFLAHLRSFYVDDQIYIWTQFLDDFVEKEDEQEEFWRYLRGESDKGAARFDILLAGCQRFVTSQASAFNLMDDDELGPFGLIHSYWLQKFFGFELGEEGHFKNESVWGESDSWATTIASSPRLTEGLDKKMAQVVQKQFTESVELLEHAFDMVRELAKSSQMAEGE